MEAEMERKQDLQSDTVENRESWKPTRMEKKLSIDVSSAGTERYEPTEESETQNIALSPFSLSLNKKMSSLKTDSTASVSNTVSFPLSSSTTQFGSTTFTSPMLKDSSIPPRQQISDLQREIANLKKEMDTKDAKLSSSMRSIKMFWSPELKKERATRKEETEKYLMVKEQYKKACEDIQKHVIRNKELEIQLEVQKKTASDESKVDADTVNRLKAEKSGLQDEIVVLQQSINQLNEKVKTLTTTIEETNKTMEETKVDNEKMLEELNEKNNAMNSLETEIDDVKESLDKAKDEICTVKKDLERLQFQEEKLVQSLASKGTEVLELQKELRDLREENKELKKEKEQQMQLTLQDEDSQEMLKNEIMALQMKVDNLESNVAVKDAEITSLQSFAESLESKASVQFEKMEQLETEIDNKDEEAKNLEEEINTLSATLNDKEAILRQREDSITVLSRDTKQQEAELVQIKETIEKKDKEIEFLNAKYEKLDGYVCERENALAQCREDISHLRSTHAKCTTAISILEGQLKEKEQLVVQLGLDCERLEKENTSLEEAMKTRVQENEESEAVKEELIRKGDLIKQLEQKANELTMKLEEHELSVDNLTRMCETKDLKIEELKEEIQQMQDTTTKLENELKVKTSKIKDLETSSLSAIDDDKENVRPASQGTQNRTIKQLWDELSKKDNKINELEKQLREKGKLLSGRRRSETTERGREAQQFSDQLKQKDEIEAKVSDLEDQIEKKEHRITVLEDALRESVSIAAEREDLLAQHVEMSEQAARKIHELESNVDRATMEKAITNIKNAFLILSVSEKDAVLGLLKTNRKKNLEEMLNMKQRALEACISEKDINIAYLEQQASSKSKKQEGKLLAQEKTKLLNELKEQTQIRMTLLNNEENKEGSLAKELSDATKEQIMEALCQVTDSSDKLEFYIEDLLTFIKEKNLELLKEMPSLPQRNTKPIERLKNSGKIDLLKELEKLGNESAQLKCYVDSLLDKLEG